MRKNNYVTLTTKGIKITLTENAWMAANLSASHMIYKLYGQCDEKCREIIALMDDFPAIPGTTGRPGAYRGRKARIFFKPSQISLLKEIFTHAQTFRAGFWDGPRTNIGSAMVFLETLDLIELLGAVASGE